MDGCIAMSTRYHLLEVEVPALHRLQWNDFSSLHLGRHEVSCEAVAIHHHPHLSRHQEYRNQARRIRRPRRRQSWDPFHHLRPNEMSALNEFAHHINILPPSHAPCLSSFSSFLVVCLVLLPCPPHPRSSSFRAQSPRT